MTTLFRKKVVALAMKILQKLEIFRKFQKSIDKAEEKAYNSLCRKTLKFSKN